MGLVKLHSFREQTKTLPIKVNSRIFSLCIDLDARYPVIFEGGRRSKAELCARVGACLSVQVLIRHGTQAPAQDVARGLV